MSNVYPIVRQMFNDSNKWKYGLSKVPVIGDWMRAFESAKRTENMMNFYGIKWEDVKYPTLLDNSSLAGFNPMAMTNQAIQDLYDIEYEPDTKHKDWYMYG